MFKSYEEWKISSMSELATERVACGPNNRFVDFEICNFELKKKDVGSIT